jgi:hypothetical protein
VMMKAYDSLLSAVPLELGPDEARWAESGDLKVWLPQGLAVLRVPEHGAAIMRTLIATDALIGPNRELWDELSRGEKKGRFVSHFEAQVPTLSAHQSPCSRILQSTSNNTP